MGAVLGPGIKEQQGRRQRECCVGNMGWKVMQGFVSLGEGSKVLAGDSGRACLYLFGCVWKVGAGP